MHCSVHCIAKALILIRSENPSFVVHHTASRIDGAWDLPQVGGGEAGHTRRGCKLNAPISCFGVLKVGHLCLAGTLIGERRKLCQEFFDQLLLAHGRHGMICILPARVPHGEPLRRLIGLLSGTAHTRLCKCAMQ